MSDQLNIVKREVLKKDYILTFSDNTKLFIDEETYFKYCIYDKETLSATFIEEIQDKTEAMQCYKKAVAYLLNGKKTENRMRLYLENKGFGPKAVDSCINRLIEEGKINDVAFTDKFIKANLKNDTKREKLIAKLIYHGIDEQLAIKEVDKVMGYEEDTY
ncbi:MAG TPA: RecX family transcriptional regulator [Clostridia bacterium]|jgi:SOS response regulatory protein OraA/RecX|nr:RecX family transcriptional regulator [Clostridia bacterium]HQC67926.1 RecX family transcriptional regulator [Clostridia bacterium]